ncbi:M20/M25/M40 family metallo-hydrolase [Paenirhodobacter sp.]|uniref:M20/M25/M40 family metallo-hydrolase n=1 Tax=Paenirhodobacter sp. TaxID=1965326 RepID=UPI003B507BD1
MRYFDTATGELIADRMRQICAGIATAQECEIEIRIWNVFDVLLNDPERAADMLSCAAEIGGAVEKTTLQMGSEDFADMLRIVPGAYCTLGHPGVAQLHNPGFIFDDAILPVGASLYARLVEVRGAA